ncbi:30S ribosomal protein S8 [Candidatus Woesearchaeota archaeon]|nr:30S ribosomal protein S8 [Candidatus Woesearchaeota archaeon]
MMNDLVSAGLSKLLNAEQRGSKECTVRPASKLLVGILKLLHSHHYIGDVELITNRKGGYLKINLLGKLNKCGSIKPRYAVKKDDFEKFEKRYLLAKDFGILVVSTQQGLMTQYDAKKKHVGGRLVAYVY